MTSLVPQSFIPGYRLQSGTDLNEALANPQWSTTMSLEATTGGTAATSTKIVNTITNITSATAGAGVTVPRSAIGKYLHIINSSANTVNVFAEGDATINGVAGTFGYDLPAGQSVTLYGVDATAWKVDNAGGAAIEYFDNVAVALRAVTPTAGQFADVGGYYAAGDGGDGQFYGVTTGGPYTHNGGTIIVPTGGDGSAAWLRIAKGHEISVRAFGAKGDSNTDDTTAIQNCINAATAGGHKVIRFPRAVADIGSSYYKITSTITVPEQIALVGDGDSITYIKVVACDGFQVASTAAASTSSVKFKDMSITAFASNGSINPKTNIGINCLGYVVPASPPTPAITNYVTNIEISGVSLSGFDTCINLQWVWNSLMQDVKTGSCLTGLRMYAKSVNNYMSDCQLSADTNCIYLAKVPVGLPFAGYYGEGFMICNTALLSANYGIKCEGFLSLNVSNCIIDLINKKGIETVGGNAYLIDNCWIAATNAPFIITNGTISATNGSPNITGSGTTWSTSGVVAGDVIIINGVNYTISSVTNNTALVLTTNYVGSNLSGNNYFIYRPFTGIDIGSVGTVLSPHYYTNFKINNCHFVMSAPVSVGVSVGYNNRGVSIDNCNFAGALDLSAGSYAVKTIYGSGSTNSQSQVTVTNCNGSQIFNLTVSGITTAPDLDALYTLGNITYTVISTNLTLGAGTITAYVTAPSGVNPAPTGTITKTNAITGDATITYSAITSAYSTQLFFASPNCLARNNHGLEVVWATQVKVPSQGLTPVAVISFNGSTLNINFNYGCSVTGVGVGNYRVTFSSQLSSDTYAPIVTAAASAANAIGVTFANVSASSFDILLKDQTGAAADSSDVNVVVYN